MQGFDELLSKWASDPLLVWKKGGQAFLTLGLYVDLHLEDNERRALTKTLSEPSTGRYPN